VAKKRSELFPALTVQNDNKSLWSFTDPEVIITVPEDSDTCEWVSVGWHTIKNCHLPEAKELMQRALAAIDAAADIPDAKAKLEEAGFRVTIDPEYWDKLGIKPDQL